MVGFFASFFVEVGCGLFPPGVLCGLFPALGGLQGGFSPPPLPEVFVVLTVVCPAWDAFPVVGMFVALVF